MRMKKKKYLAQRLALCEKCLICRTFFGSEPSERSFYDVFEADKPVWLEIGCGKGAFINQMAKLYPGVNFIAAEKCENVAVSAMERTLSEKIPNVLYIVGLAEYLEQFIPPGSIERIYLNFSCPFPKKKHEKHRLTHPEFLKIYNRILKAHGKIFFKTDNSDFFEYSVGSFLSNNFLLPVISRDLHNSGIAGNIITEYEEYFSRKGIKIKYLEACR